MIKTIIILIFLLIIEIIIECTIFKGDKYE